jgi:hypothetical protein
MTGSYLLILLSTVLFRMTEHSQTVPSISGYMPTSESTITFSVPESPVTSVSASRSAFWAEMISRAEDTGIVFSYHVRRNLSSGGASTGVVQWIADKEMDRRDLFESDPKEGFTGLWKSFRAELHKGVFRSPEMPDPEAVNCMLLNLKQQITPEQLTEEAEILVHVYKSPVAYAGRERETKGGRWHYHMIAVDRVISHQVDYSR